MVFVLNSWVSWVDFCWVVVLIRVRVAVVGGSDLGLVHGLLCGLVLLSPSIFRWRNSSPAPPSSSQPVLRFDFSVCSVNRVHQSPRRSGCLLNIGFGIVCGCRSQFLPPDFYVDLGSTIGF